MNKTKLNYFIDSLMAVSFIIVVFTGLIIFLFLPSGVKQGGYQEFTGIIKSTWVTIHNWAGIMMIILVVVHFALHWKWFITMTKSFLKGGKDGKTKWHI